MTKNVTLFAVLAIGVLMHLFSAKSFAQGTDGSGMILRVSIDGTNYDYNEGACGFSTTTWGGSLTDEFCAQIAWGYGINGDSLGCDSIVAGTLNGKIGMIRRGVCEFGFKSRNAERAGAIACIIVNGTAASHGDDCNAPGAGAGAVGAQVTIPVILICRQVGNQIDAALKAGSDVNVCFLLPRLSSPFAGYHYATPVSQASLLDNIGFNFNNRESTTIDDMTITAEIKEPSGAVTTITNAVPAMAPGTDTLLFFEYTPPAEKGTFEVTYYSNKYSESRDTLHRTFVQTDYTFASDNMTLQLDGGADRNDLFAGDLLYQVGSMVATGDNGGVATHATFGVANIDSVYVAGNDLANTLTVFLYDGDANDNGRLDLDGDFSALDIKGIGTYVLQGNETEENLVDAEILDLLSGDLGVTMDANHLYYVSVQYNGQEAGLGRNCAFSNSAYVPYLFYSTEAGDFRASAPILLGGTLSYWGDRTVVCRLQLQGYTPTISTKSVLLDSSKFSVSPNPATDHMMLDLNLAQQGDVDLSIINPRGQRLYSQYLSNFQGGQVNMDVHNVPSGIYMMVIKTNEGVGVKKVAICH